MPRRFALFTRFVAFMVVPMLGCAAICFLGASPLLANDSPGAAAVTTPLAATPPLTNTLPLTQSAAPTSVIVPALVDDLMAMNKVNVGEAQAIAYAPDGTRIAVASNRRILLLDS